MNEDIKVKNSPLKLICGLIFGLMILITVGLFGATFIKPLNAIEVSQNYIDESSVRNSKAYTYAVSAVSSVKEIEEIDDIQAIMWIYIWQEKTESLSVYIKVEYMSGGENNIRCYSYIMRKNQNGWGKQIKSEIEVAEYNKKRALWMTLKDEKDAAWAKEKRYNEYAISIILKEV